MCAGAHGKRELVEILFPWTKPIPSMPEWSVDGIIRGMRYLRFEAQVFKWFPMGTTFSDKTALAHSINCNIYHVGEPL